MMYANDIRGAFGVVTDVMNTSQIRNGLRDTLGDTGILDEMAHRHALSYRPDHTQAEYAEIRQLRMRLEEFLRVPDVERRMALVNSLLLTAGSIPQLARHDGDEQPHFHYTMDDATFSSKAAALSAVGLARLITSDTVERFRVCNGSDCNKVFIDTSKNGLRQYCDSQACGNRLHAARYRARKTDRDVPEDNVA